MGQQSSVSVQPTKGDSNGVLLIDPVEEVNMMKAWVVTSPNPDFSKINLTKVPKPTPSNSQALIKMACASVNPVDIMRVGSESCAFPAILGTDGSGIVESIGNPEDASSLGIAVGDAVCFHVDATGSYGTFAEYTAVDINILCKMDKEPSSVSLSFSDAATLPSSAWTAYIALFDKLKVEKGRIIFIDGCAGGVGSYAIQFAKMMGLIVIATCSTYNVDYLRRLGADAVIDYVMDDVSKKLNELTEGRGVDYLLELVSPDQAAGYARHIRFGGALCQVGGAIRAFDPIFFHQQLSVHHVNLNGLHKSPLTAPLLRYVGDQCIAMLLNKLVLPCHSEVVALGQVRDVLQMLSKGHARGKIVVQISKSLCNARKK